MTPRRPISTSGSARWLVLSLGAASDQNRRLLVDGGDGFSASACGQGADARHLLDERCQVFGFGFCNRVAQFDKLGLVAVAFAIRWQRRSTEEVGDLFPEPLLFRNDGKSGRGRLDWPRHGVRSMPGKPIRGNGSRQKTATARKMTRAPLCAW